MNRQRLDSMHRALAHHEATGAIHTYSPPEPGGRRTWRVHLFRQDEPIEVNTSGLYALLCGLAAGEQRERAHIDRQSTQQTFGPEGVTT